MSAKLIDGKKIAAEIEEELKLKVSNMKIAPRLSVVQVGEDPASTSYIRAKSNAAKRVGIDLTHHHLSEEISKPDLEKLVIKFNRKKNYSNQIIKKLAYTGNQILLNNEKEINKYI